MLLCEKVRSLRSTWVCAVLCCAVLCCAVLIRVCADMPPKKEEEPEVVLLGRFGTSLKIGIVGLPNVG